MNALTIRRTLTRLVSSLLACQLMVLTSGSARSASEEVDWSAIAQIILHRGLHLAAGQRVIIHYLPGREPGLLEALRSEITQSGAIVSAEWTWPDQDMSSFFESLTIEQKAQLADSQNKVYRDIFAISDAYLWLDESPVDELVSRQFEHLINESKVRAVHCHFAGAPDPHDNPSAWQMYMRAIEVDPAQLQASEDDLVQHLKGANIRMRSREGTDLRFKVPKDAWFHENTGDASQGKIRNPLSTRDREEEIPAGDIRTNGVTGINGKLVASVGGDPADLATLTFAKGLLVKIEPNGKHALEFAQWFESASGDRNRIGELVIGNNPYLTPVAKINPAADFGYSAGTVRLDIGENWEAGGDLRTGDHRQWAFIVTDATLEADGRLMISAGQLLR